MAGMVSRLTALETGDAPEHSKPGDLAGPKPNALRENPQEEPIPPIPASVRGYPTPWVTEYDVLSYVYPLYTRGWGQSLTLWKPPPQKEARDRPLDRYTMLLSARYRFQDYVSAASFFLKVASAVKAEDVSVCPLLRLSSYLLTLPAAPSIRTHRAREPVYSYSNDPDPLGTAPNLARRDRPAPFARFATSTPPGTRTSRRTPTRSRRRPQPRIPPPRPFLPDQNPRDNPPRRPPRHPHRTHLLHPVRSPPRRPRPTHPPGLLPPVVVHHGARVETPDPLPRA